MAIGDGFMAFAKLNPRFAPTASPAISNPCLKYRKHNPRFPILALYLNGSFGHWTSKTSLCANCFQQTAHSAFYLR